MWQDGRAGKDAKYHPKCLYEKLKKKVSGRRKFSPIIEHPDGQA